MRRGEERKDKRVMGGGVVEHRRATFLNKKGKNKIYKK
jgi:hypothetical protein